jgi:O-antigen/teichoic acid export membrane protein
MIIGAPVTVFLIVFAEPAMRFAYGPQYSGMALVLSLLAAATLITMINSVIVTIFLGIAAPGLHRLYSFLRVVILSATIVPAVRLFGIAGAPIAVLTALAAIFAVQQNRLAGLVGIRGRDVIASGAGGLLLAGFALVLSLGARTLITQPLTLHAGGYTASIEAMYVSAGAGLAICAGALAAGVLRIVTAKGKSQ